MLFSQTFFWSDKDNNIISNLENFTDVFLQKCHLAKMICKYMVLTRNKKMMILRPYQFYAVELIVQQISNSDKNGYIWHTTGSGKTLTSFKASQILMNLPNIDKVVFVVDRKDLDSQTTNEFNAFCEGSVDSTDNTIKLVKQFNDDTKLIVTTIQKLNTAITRKTHLQNMQDIKNKKVVFIFDECHRSQFGQTHLEITKFFKNAQMIGFTGTPILEQNALNGRFGKRTTSELFGDCLHKYIITDAINDGNVLKFSIEYVGKYKEKEDIKSDIQVQAIDTKELLQSEQRVDKITNWIIANHNRKTHNKEFTAIMCVDSVESLIKYYKSFKSKTHDLKIATIFSYKANEAPKEEIIGEIDFDDEGVENKLSKEKLQEYINDYNKIFNCKFSINDFYLYNDDISRKVKQKQIDILLVVNMFLTGFDSKTLNTLYVDKNLKYHGLIQAFSRTNRVLNEKKSQGNIVCFRNLKDDVDEAIKLFSNPLAKDIVLMQNYEFYLDEFNKKYEILKIIAPNVDFIDELKSEDSKLDFITAFRDLLKLKNILEGFSSFTWKDLNILPQTFEDYKSKYLDLHEDIKRLSKEVEKVSILQDVDFELELIHKDEINVDYILQLIEQIEPDKERSSQIANILSILNSNPKLRSKKELIEKFINKNFLQSTNLDFNEFLETEKNEALKELCKDENLDEDGFLKIIDDYLYTQRTPFLSQIEKIMKIQLKIKERNAASKRVLDKILDFVQKFY